MIEKLKKNLPIILLLPIIFPLIIHFFVLVKFNQLNKSSISADTKFEIKKIFENTIIDFEHQNPNFKWSKYDSAVYWIQFNELLKYNFSKIGYPINFSYEIKDNTQHLFKGFVNTCKDHTYMKIITKSFNEITRKTGDKLHINYYIITSSNYNTHSISQHVVFFIIVLGFSVLIISVLILRWDKQRKQNKHKVDVIQGVTHELKSNITTILLANEFNEKNINSQKSAEYNKIIKDEAIKMQDLLSQLLNLSQIEKGEFEIEVEDINLNNLLSDIIANHKFRIESCNGEVHLMTSSESIIIKGDLRLLKMCFSNLIDNSIKYSDKSPIININIEEKNKEVVISIQDNGIGIHSKYHKRIFEQMFRINNGSSNKKQGTGIGLFFVKQIVKLHKGEITVESEINKGSTFFVSLPKIY